MKNGPGKAHREGVTMIQLANMFPDEEAARKWLEDRIWKGSRACPRCGSEKTRPVKSGKPMPYWCAEGRHYYSVKHGTVMEQSNIPLRKWVFAIYLHLTNLKGVSSMKLHRDIGVTQATAWFMLQRIRKAFENDDDPMSGPVEVDETWVGGIDRNRHRKDRKGRESAGGKAPVVGAKDRVTKQVRALVIPETDRLTLRTFVRDHVAPGAILYTDDAAAYRGEWGYDHDAVRHSVGEYVRGMAHTNGIESFWSMLKRAHKGVYHKISVKHLQRYIHEFAGRHGIREFGTLRQMGRLAEGMAGKRLTYRELVA